MRTDENLTCELNEIRKEVDNLKKEQKGLQIWTVDSPDPICFDGLSSAQQKKAFEDIKEAILKSKKLFQVRPNSCIVVDKIAFFRIPEKERGEKK